MPKRGSDELLTTSIHAFQQQQQHLDHNQNGPLSVSGLFNGNSALLAAAIMTAESEAKKAKFESCAVLPSLQNISSSCNNASFPSCFTSALGTIGAQLSTANTNPGANFSPANAAAILASFQQQQVANTQQLRALANANGQPTLSTAQLLYNGTNTIGAQQQQQSSAGLSSCSQLDTPQQKLQQWLTAAKCNGMSGNGGSSSGGRQASKVVHLRNIPSDMTELELVRLREFVNISIEKMNDVFAIQAFVEYEEESSAQSLVNVADACPMAIRGRTIFCQFSTHQELKTDRKSSTKDGSIFGGDESCSASSVGFANSIFKKAGKI